MNATSQSWLKKRGTRGTSASAAPGAFEEHNTTQLKGKKIRDIYAKVYNVRGTIFSDQIGQFPKRLLRGNKYIMVLVEINSTVILVAPTKSQHGEEIKRAYTSMVTHLHQAGIVPKKHVLDKKVSESMKAMIRDKYHMTMELVPPGCHRHNAAEVAIQSWSGCRRNVPRKMGDRASTATALQESSQHGFF